MSGSDGEWIEVNGEQQTHSTSSVKKIHITYVLDMSGSMWQTLDGTIEGFNSFIKQQKEDPNGECFLTLILFDDEYQVVYKDKKIQDVENLTSETFVPRGQTALLDAIGKTINSVPHIDSQTNNIIIVIHTDGHENSSKEYTWETISEIISKKKDENWEFIFLGANQDAIETAAKINIDRGSALTYSNTPQHSSNSMHSVSNSISRRRSGQDRRINFSPMERTSSIQHSSSNPTEQPNRIESNTPGTPMRRTPSRVLR